MLDNLYDYQPGDTIVVKATRPIRAEVGIEYQKQLVAALERGAKAVYVPFEFDLSVFRQGGHRVGDQ